MTQPDRCSLLPQPARSDDPVIQLAPDGLQRLFAESVPATSRLAPEAARIALMMHLAGRDSVAIARRVGASPSAVSLFLARAEEAAKRAAEPAAPVVGHAREPEQVGAQPVVIASVPPAPASTPPVPAPEVQQAAAPVVPDAELTPLQQSTIRGLRKLHVPAAAIAIGMRVTVDQVLRISGEAP
jgi:hypothetical protein